MNMAPAAWKHITHLKFSSEMLAKEIKSSVNFVT